MCPRVVLCYFIDLSRTSLGRDLVFLQKGSKEKNQPLPVNRSRLSEKFVEKNTSKWVNILPNVNIIISGTNQISDLCTHWTFMHTF